MSKIKVYRGYLLSLTAIAMISMLMTVSGFGQEQQKSAFDQAFALFQAKNYEEAGKSFEAVTKTEPENGRAWFWLGSTRHFQGNYSQAITAFEQADKLNFNRSGVSFSIARAYARLGEKDKAFELLKKASDNGFRNLQALANDVDINLLRDDPRFSTFVSQIKSLTKPCNAQPEFRRFDFFIGEWEQQNRAGQIVGSTSVKLILENCVLEERTSNPQSNYAAQAFHYFDPTLGKWRQSYVDTAAGFSLWTGESKDGEIRYRGEMSSPDGKKTLTRSTYTQIDKNKINVVFEVSNDDGKTWTTGWNGFFVRKPTTIP